VLPRRLLAASPVSLTLALLCAGAAIKFCSAETAERMAQVAWGQALELTRREAEADGVSDLAAAFDRFRSAVGVACTAALATNYSKKGPHEAFVVVCRATPTPTPDAHAIAPQCDAYHLTLDKAVGRSREGTSAV